MEKKEYSIETIGFVLALLYATSCLIFIQYLNIPGFEGYTYIYGILFGALFIGSLAVIALKEWGRKLLILLNTVMLFFIASRYIPKIDLVPLGYLFMNVIVLLYFTQENIRGHFHEGKYEGWNKSILVVDDDEMIIKILRPALLSHGYSVLAANTGEDGLQVANTQKPELILLDVILPGIKGREVCAKLKENPETRDIPVVFLTSKDSPEDIAAEEAAGSSGHMTKPVDTKLVVKTIQEILESKDKSKKS